MKFHSAVELNAKVSTQIGMTVQIDDVITLAMISLNMGQDRVVKDRSGYIAHGDSLQRAMKKVDINRNLSPEIQID